MDIELASNFKLFAAARPTLSPSYFLCFFSREGIVNTDDVRYCIAQTTGDTLGPIVLNLEETDSGVYTDAQVELYAGDWQLTVYEQTSDTNYNPTNSGRVVWSELVRVNEPSTALPTRPDYVCQGGETGGTVDIYFTDGVTLFRQVTAGNTLTLFPVEILQTNNDGDDVPVGYLDLVSDDGFNFGASPVLQASTVTDTLGLTEVVKLIAAQTWPLPASSIAYFDQTGAVAYWADVNTGFVDSKIRPATTLPRFTIFESDGVTVAAYRDLLDNTYTLAACDPLTATLSGVEIINEADPCGVDLVLSCSDLIDAVVVEGAGTSAYNGLWKRDVGNDYDGKPVYRMTGLDVYAIAFAEQTWAIAVDIPVLDYYGYFDPTSSPLSFPWEVASWQAEDADAPAPTVRQATIADLCPCAACDLDVIINVNGVEAANVTGLDPCEENTINLTMV